VAIVGASLPKDTAHDIGTSSSRIQPSVLWTPEEGEGVHMEFQKSIPTEPHRQAQGPRDWLPANGMQHTPYGLDSSPHMEACSRAERRRHAWQGCRVGKGGYRSGVDLENVKGGGSLGAPQERPACAAVVQAGVCAQPAAVLAESLACRWKKHAISDGSPSGQSWKGVRWQRDKGGVFGVSSLG
jgi:hypothetical protein